MYRKRLKGYAAIGYSVLSKDNLTLFDNIDSLQSSSYEGQIFNGSTFRQSFTKTLKSSKQSVVVSSPKLYHTERNAFVKILKELQTNGIEVAIITSASNEQTEYLKKQGLFVRVVPNLSLCSCVIDKSIVWYGSINLLGYPTEEDSIIKCPDFKLATELLDIIFCSDKQHDITTQ